MHVVCCYLHVVKIEITAFYQWCCHYTVFHCLLWWTNKLTLMLLTLLIEWLYSGPETRIYFINDDWLVEQTVKVPYW